MCKKSKGRTLPPVDRDNRKEPAIPEPAPGNPGVLKEIEPHPLGNSLVDRDLAAQRLRLQPATLADWAVQGIGPPMVKIGRLVRYRVADLEKYINEREVSSTATFGRRG